MVLVGCGSFRIIGEEEKDHGLFEFLDFTYFPPKIRSFWKGACLRANISRTVGVTNAVLPELKDSSAVS